MVYYTLNIQTDQCEG